MPGGIYVASSWRNTKQPTVVESLMAAGVDVYDFRKPKLHSDGFHWSEVMPSYREGQSLVTPLEYLDALDNQRSEDGFELDFNAMKRCDGCLLVLPCNRSAHLELGWFCGKGKPTAILLEEAVTPELMYKMVDLITDDLDMAVKWAVGVQSGTTID